MNLLIVGTTHRGATSRSSRADPEAVRLMEVHEQPLIYNQMTHRYCLPQDGRRFAVAVAEPFVDLAAARGELERSAHLAHSLDRQAGDPGAEQLLGDEREAVERERALLRHSVVFVE
jgi:hypothetical protein